MNTIRNKNHNKISRTNNYDAQEDNWAGRSEEKCISDMRVGGRIHRYTNDELVDVHLVYGVANCRGTPARELPYYQPRVFLLMRCSHVCFFD